MQAEPPTPKSSDSKPASGLLAACLAAVGEKTMPATLKTKLQQVQTAVSDYLKDQLGALYNTNNDSKVVDHMTVLFDKHSPKYAFLKDIAIDERHPFKGLGSAVVEKQQSMQPGSTLMLPGGLLSRLEAVALDIDALNSSGQPAKVVKLVLGWPSVDSLAIDDATAISAVSPSLAPPSEILKESAAFLMAVCALLTPFLSKPLI